MIIVSLKVTLINGKNEEFCKLENYFEIDNSLNGLEQDDPVLIEAIKGKLISPSDNKIPYNFKRPVIDVRGQFGEVEELASNVFGDKMRGFFIEAGAYDGELLSNTLHFEANMKWRGLLVEPNPDFFKELTTKNRKAHLFGHCLSTKPTPEVVSFDAAGVYGGIINDNRKPGGVFSISNPNHDFYYQRKTLEMQCFPLYSILLALGNPTVDLFSLDIEGAELLVLRSIPWKEVDIRVIVLEVHHIGKIFDEKSEDLTEVMNENGYKLFKEVGINQIYIKNDFKLESSDTDFEGIWSKPGYKRNFGFEIK